MDDVLDADDNITELPKKKRIRTTTTSLACEMCRLKVRYSQANFFFSPFFLFSFLDDGVASPLLFL
jgi:hypothetical protein